MTQAEHIDLRTGAGRGYSRVTGFLWLLSLGSLLLMVRDLHWSLILASLALLGVLRPGTARRPQSATLRLHFDGSAELGAARGTWAPPPRVTQWITVVPVRVAGQSRRVLVCASRNHRQDYRRLLVWSRFPPTGSRAEGT